MGELVARAARVDGVRCERTSPAASVAHIEVFAANHVVVIPLRRLSRLRKRLFREPALLDAAPRPSGRRFLAAAASVVGNTLGNDEPVAAAQTRSNCTKQPVFTGAARIGEALGAGGRESMGVRVPPPASTGKARKCGCRVERSSSDQLTDLSGLDADEERHHEPPPVAVDVVKTEYAQPPQLTLHIEQMVRRIPILERLPDRCKEREMKRWVADATCSKFANTPPGSSRSKISR